MKEEDAEEGEEAQRIQLGPIKSFLVALRHVCR
jgi:hypothetical protein